MNGPVIMVMTHSIVGVDDSGDLIISLRQLEIGGRPSNLTFPFGCRPARFYGTDQDASYAGDKELSIGGEAVATCVYRAKYQEKVPHDSSSSPEVDPAPRDFERTWWFEKTTGFLLKCTDSSLQAWSCDEPMAIQRNQWLQVGTERVLCTSIERRRTNSTLRNPVRVRSWYSLEVPGFLVKEEVEDFDRPGEMRRRLEVLAFSVTK